jgi:hypothetical protein
MNTNALYRKFCQQMGGLNWWQFLQIIERTAQVHVMLRKATYDAANLAISTPELASNHL